MNWISHLSTATTILLALDTASLGVSTLFFSPRIRRFVQRRKWGLLHGAIPHIDTIELPPIEEAPKRPMRGSVTLLHNPFEPKPRKISEPAAVQIQLEESPRPNFRKRIALQQRISKYERAIGRFAPYDEDGETSAAPSMESIRIGLLVPSTPSSRSVFEQALHC
jgi:hypothetical protein